jgi:hypothetical protein
MNTAADISVHGRYSANRVKKTRECGFFPDQDDYL